MNLHKPLKSIIALMLIIAMAVGMAASMGGKAEAVSVKCTLKGQGGTINGKSEYVLSSYSGAQSTAPVTIPTVVPVRSGYYFAGYSEKEGSTVVKYFPGQLFYATGNCSLWCVWVRQNSIYQITYNSNGGTYVGNYDYQCKQYWQYISAGQKVSLTKCKFTAPDRKCGGWSTTPGGAVKYSECQTITASSKLTLYPRWQVQVEIHTMVPQPSDGKAVKRTVLKDNKSNEWKYEKNTIKEEIPLPDGYYFGDKEGNKISENTLCKIGLVVYLWPYKDEITIRWAGTSETMVVYTGLSLASSYSKGSSNSITSGREYPLGDRFLENGKTAIMIGWKMTGGKMKNQIVTPGYRMVCSGASYYADAITKVDNCSMGFPLHISGSELKVLWELTESKWKSQKPSSSATLKKITNQVLLAYIGIRGGKILGLVTGVYGGITGTAAAIKNGFYFDTGKHAAFDVLYGNLMALAKDYDEVSDPTKDFYVYMMCHVERIKGKDELIIDSMVNRYK